MIVELSPTVYRTLCGLVQDALQYPSDATNLLKRAAEELTRATEAANEADEQEEEEAILRVVGR